MEDLRINAYCLSAHDLNNKTNQIILAGFQIIT